MKLIIEIARQRRVFKIDALEAFEKYGFCDGTMPGASAVIDTVLKCLRANLPGDITASIMNTCGHNDYIMLTKNGKEVDVEKFFSNNPRLLEKIQKLEVEIDFY